MHYKSCLLTPPCKDDNARFKSVLFINNVEDIVDSPGFKMFISDNSNMFFLHIKCASHFSKETTEKKSVYKILKIAV